MDLHLVTVLSCWEGDVVGFANVHTASWEVETLYVAPARRRRGVARALLKAVDRWARGYDWGRDGLRARVPVSPAAAALLAELGIPEAPHRESELAVSLEILGGELLDIEDACASGEDWPAGFCTPCYDRWAQERAEKHVQRHLGDTESARRSASRRQGTG
ncbi:GNAT family N-acetyltransferase [Streptomyces sp. DK15]|uniref:GNAT family N-acetyltransferase n=1 Tax=Streptomyces sp. DK15 TaxID=2957499 RepID=UPI0029AE915D|nr:GNAT family N-acetyltransferase [Streptomyces sp. DK15]MDX2394947.1 GNAT family N-acetyltransferase [Streptomyces sp. DK15]